MPTMLTISFMDDHDLYSNDFLRISDSLDLATHDCMINGGASLYIHDRYTDFHCWN